MRRMRDRYQEFGYTGLFDQRRGKRSIHRVPMQTAEEVLRLYREVYFDLNIRHFHEKLGGEHSIGLSYTWVQKALQGAGLVAKRQKRGPHRRRRPRRPLPGMLLHIDGSKHQWLNDDRWHDLIVILDDATSEIYYAQLVEEESTRTVMRGLREVMVDKNRPTQVGRAMKELGVQMIAAYSPQARGRSERSSGTWQGRLPQELRLAGITIVDGANAFLNERYIGEFNEKLSAAAEEKGTAFRRTSRSDLNWIFTEQTERVVAKDNTVAIAARSRQIDKTRFRYSLAGCAVTIHEHLDGTISIRYGPHVVGTFEANGERRGKEGSPPKPRPSHFPTATTATALSPKLKRKAARAA